MNKTFRLVKFTTPLIISQSNDIHNMYKKPTYNYHSLYIAKPKTIIDSPFKNYNDNTFELETYVSQNKKASFFSRICAVLLDELVSSSINLLLQNNIPMIISEWAYHSYCLYYNEGQSLGKKIFGLRTVYTKRPKNKLSLLTCLFLPCAYYSVFLYPLAFLVFYPHDLLTGTTVIYDSEIEELN